MHTYAFKQSCVNDSQKTSRTVCECRVGIARAKKIGSSRSIHLLFGNPSAHAIEAYRDSGEARCAKSPHDLPGPCSSIPVTWGTTCMPVCSNKSRRGRMGRGIDSSWGQGCKMPYTASHTRGGERCPNVARAEHVGTHEPLGTTVIVAEPKEGSTLGEGQDRRRPKKDPKRLADKRGSASTQPKTSRRAVSR